MLADIVVDLQYGDCGKGKVAHHLCREKDYTHVIRYNGGCNAGHTIYHHGKKFITHHIPCGVFYGIKSIIGPGCVIHVETFLQEIEVFDGYTITMKHTIPSPYTRTTNYKVVKNKDILSTVTTIHSCANIHNDIPIMLSTLDGEIYNIFGWGECLNEVNDFTKKVKETYPIFNNEEEKWSYVFDWEDKPNKVFCLNSYLQKVLAKEVDIQEPIFLIWDTPE